MTQELLTFDVHLEPADWTRYCQVIVRRNVTIRVINVTLITLILLVALVILSQRLQQALPILVTIGVMLIAVAIQRQATALALRPRKDGALLGRKTISIEVQGLRSRTSTAEAFYDWTAFESAAATDHLLVLLFEPAVGLIIPRRALHPEDFHTLILLIRQYCPRLEADLQGV